MAEKSLSFGKKLSLYLQRVSRRFTRKRPKGTQRTGKKSVEAFGKTRRGKQNRLRVSAAYNWGPLSDQWKKVNVGIRAKRRKENR